MLSDFAEPLHLKNDLSSGKCLKIILCSGKDVQLIELLKQLLNSCYEILCTICMENFEKEPLRFSPPSVSLRQKSSFRGQGRFHPITV